MRKEKVINLIRKIPGISYNEIVRETNLSNGVVSHYLIKLLEKGEIEKEGIKRGKYFVRNISKKDREIITVLRNKTNNEIFHLLMKYSKKDIAFTAKEIQKKVKKSGSTISICLKILQKNNIVERVIMHKKSKITSDLGYKIYNEKLWTTFVGKYNL